MSDCCQRANPANERVDAPSRLVTRQFEPKIDGRTQVQFRPQLGQFAGLRDAFMFVCPPYWISGKDSGGESVGMSCWLLEAAATVSLVCRILYCSVRLIE